MARPTTSTTCSLAARNHAGLGWHEHHADVHDGCERFFRTMYNAHLVGEWLPALDGVVEKLERGATVADVGCGHGASTVIMAQAFPNSTFTGFDYHEASIAAARERAIEAGVRRPRAVRGRRCDRSSPVPGYDLVTTFDALHDMGDPVGAARHVLPTARARRHLDGRRADGRRQRQRQPQPGRTGLLRVLHPAVHARVARRRRSVWRSAPRLGPPASATSSTAGGFTRFRIAAETPFNRVLEIRP